MTESVLENWRSSLAEKTHFTAHVRSLIERVRSEVGEDAQVFRTENDGMEWIVLPTVFSPMIFALGEGSSIMPSNPLSCNVFVF